VKIGILFNGQHESLRVALGALLPGTGFVSLDMAQALTNEPLRGQFAAALASCDHVISQDAAPEYGALSTPALRATVRRLHVLPGFRFAGFHPDTVNIVLDGAEVGGPTGVQHSRIAVAGFLAGLSVRETADLYNRLVFARLGYFDKFAAERAALLARYGAYGIDLRDAFDAWLVPGCFMQGVHQPRMRVMLDLARAVCALAGLEPTAAAVESDLPDPLAGLPLHPVFPDIAKACGVAPSGAFRGAAAPGRRAPVMGAEAFVKACQDLFRRTPVATLRAVDGVASALAALGLAEATRPAPPRRASGPQTTAFITWHGAVLGIETASGLLINRDVTPEDSSSVDLLADFPDRAIATPIQSEMMGGVAIAPVAQSGGVSIARGTTFLCAIPGNLGVRFNRAAASYWESFLPVAASDLENLRRLAGGNWIVQGTFQRLPASVIRVLNGFQFAVGDLVLDMRREMPEPIEDSEAELSFRIGTGAAAVILVPDPAPASRDEILLQTAQNQPLAELGTEEEFRLIRDGRLRLAAPAELLHPPLTACDRDRDWMHQRYFDRSAGPGVAESFHLPRLGRRACDVTLLRGSEKLLMLGRSVEGVLADGAHVVKDGGFLLQPTHAPPHVRFIGQARLLDRQQADAAPVIEGPVCVFYNPNLQNYYHWVAEALLVLHVLAPHLPPGTRLALPATLAEFRRSGATYFDHTRYLAALGFGQYPTIELSAPFVKLRDAIWLENDSIYGMPATALQSFRARAHAMRPPPKSPSRRLFIKRAGSRGIANSAALETLLATRGFETVTLENMPAAAQIDLFGSADFVIATHGSALANVLFCQAGTRVLELSPDCEYRSYFWLCAEKLGLPYGVLPCPTSTDDFNGELTVDETRLVALVDMLGEVVG
jgi:capsular polysaccharide biosynthesis protein